MADEAPKFGNYLRAARLGFHWYEPLKRYIRMADDGPEHIVITVCTPSALPSHCAREEYRCWWEGQPENLLSLCPALHALKLTSGLQVLVVDNDGLEVKPSGRAKGRKVK